MRKRILGFLFKTLFKDYVSIQKRQSKNKAMVEAEHAVKQSWELQNLLEKAKQETSESFVISKTLREENSRLKDEICILNKKTLFYYYVDRNSIDEWSKCLELCRRDAFKTLIRFIANSYEEQEMNVIRGEEEKFWHIQGAKAVLHQLLTFEPFIIKTIERLAGKVQPGQGVNASPDVTYT